MSIFTWANLYIVQLLITCSLGVKFVRFGSEDPFNVVDRKSVV